MLSLWYIILGWKEYNKPFIKQERPGSRPADPPRKPDLIPQKTPGPGEDVRKPEPPKSVLPPAPQVPDVPKPSLPKDIPKVPETQKLPDLPKGPPKIPERPNPPRVSPPKLSDVVKGTPKTPEVPKPPPKIPDLPKPGSRGPDSPKLAPKTPDSPKVPDFSKAPKVPERPDISGGMIPSRKPDSDMPTFPPSGKNPMVGPPNQEFPLPPYLPGAPSNPKPPMKGDELFAIGNNRKNQGANGARQPMGDLRDLSYSKGELPPGAFESAGKKVQQNLPKMPKYMADSTVSNPDSLDSSGEEEEEEDDD